MTPYITPILVNLAYQVPSLLVFLVGIILALVWMKRHPAVSIMAIIAFILFGFTTVAGVIKGFLPVIMNYSGANFSRIATITGFANIILTVINLIGWILIVIAVFGWRRARQAELELSAVPG